MSDNFEPRPCVDEQDQGPRHDLTALDELVEFIELLGESSLGSATARAAREVGIRALRASGCNDRVRAADPLVVQAQYLAAERFARRGDTHTEQVICRSLLAEPVTDDIWSVQCKAAARLSDVEHVTWLARTAKNGYRPAGERLNNVVKERLRRLLADNATTSDVAHWLNTTVTLPCTAHTQSPITLQSGLFDELLRRWLGDPGADEILDVVTLRTSFTSELVTDCSVEKSNLRPVDDRSAERAEERCAPSRASRVFISYKYKDDSVQSLRHRLQAAATDDRVEFGQFKPFRVRMLGDRSIGKTAFLRNIYLYACESMTGDRAERTVTSPPPVSCSMGCPDSPWRHTQSDALSWWRDVGWPVGSAHRSAGLFEQIALLQNLLRVANVADVGDSQFQEILKGWHRLEFAGASFAAVSVADPIAHLPELSALLKTFRTTAVTHGDLNSANVLLTGGGHCHLIDCDAVEPAQQRPRLLQGHATGLGRGPSALELCEARYSSAPYLTNSGLFVPRQGANAGQDPDNTLVGPHDFPGPPSAVSSSREEPALIGRR